MVPKFLTDFVVSMTLTTLWRWLAVLSLRSQPLLVCSFLIGRRASNSRVRSATTRNDVFMYVVLVLVILAGTAGYSAFGSEPLGRSASGEWSRGSLQHRETISVWFRSLFYFHPEVALMVNIPVAFKIHIVVAMVLFIIWPSLPACARTDCALHYLFRPTPCTALVAASVLVHVEVNPVGTSRVSAPTDIHISILQKRKYEHPAARSYDLKNGQLRNVLLATFASTIGFWAWTVAGPLAKIR